MKWVLLAQGRVNGGAVFWVMKSRSFVDRLLHGSIYLPNYITL
jgi:hypothetical protein